jgi:putative membrane protein
MIEFLRLVYGTVIYRPYVYIFFICFLIFSLKHLRFLGTLSYLILSYLVAFACEFSATRNGFPFGKYVYLDGTRTRELWISNVPFWDSLSFVFLSYFSWIVAGSVRNPAHPSNSLFDAKTAFLGGFLMMLLDLVIDPVALRGDQWFLGKIYYYPEGGFYFGVTLSNFVGWWFVGTVTLLSFKTVWQIFSKNRWNSISRTEGWGALGVYTGIFTFNLIMTAWIQNWELFIMSSGVTLLTLTPCYFIYLNRRSIHVKNNSSRTHPALCSHGF